LTDTISILAKDRSEKGLVEEKVNEKSKGAKDYSLFSMIVAGLWIMVLTILKGVGIIKSLEVKEIIYTGITIAGVFSPVYFSILLDKIKELKV